jgi:hypothetical protein
VDVAPRPAVNAVAAIDLVSTSHPSVLAELRLADASHPSVLADADVKYYSVLLNNLIIFD